MSTDTMNEGIAIPGETPQTQGHTPEAPSADVDTESRARAMGWVPQEEFRGPAENWRSADEFVRRGEENPAIMRERMRDMQTRIARFEAQLNETQRRHQDEFARLEHVSAVALRRQREQLEANYNHAMREAAANGDVTRYDQLERDRRTALTHADEQVQQATQRQPEQRQDVHPSQTPEYKATFDPWLSRNQWMVADPEMQAVAVTHSAKLSNERPGMTLAENLAETEAYVRKRYPEKFGRPSQGAVVEGGARVAAAPTNGRGPAHLPPEARRAGERFVKEGLYKSMSEYANEYFSLEGV